MSISLKIAFALVWGLTLCGLFFSLRARRQRRKQQPPSQPPPPDR